MPPATSSPLGSAVFGWRRNPGLTAPVRPASWRWPHGLLAALLALCTAQGSSAAPKWTVLYFGDSITAGSQLPVPHRFTDRWPAIAEQLSSGRYAECNEGLGGRSTDALADFTAMLARHPSADVLVLALGTNDSRDLSPESVPKAAGRIRQMIAAARTLYPALRILLVGPPNLNLDRLGPTKPIGPQRDANLRALAVSFAGLAEELDCGFVSFYGVVPPGALNLDGVHPDAAGNQALARAALTALDALARPGTARSLTPAPARP